MVQVLCDNHSMAEEKIRKVTFGRALQHYASLVGLKQAKLGQLVGVSQNTVSRWWHQADPPDERYLARLAEVLPVSGDDLREGIIRTGGGQEQSEHDQLVTMAARRARTPEELEKLVEAIENMFNMHPAGVSEIQRLMKVFLSHYGVRPVEDGEEGQEGEKVDLQISQ